mgnify:CR=1 FL=1|tara:strand:- start:2288 stop:3388 length:1101 start_codon:yes stop_codon:yes gene_type:complete
MGFLSKVWKGIKTGFKSIGKKVKKAFNSFGKFMGKIGILGQLAMAFILPGIGSLFTKGLGSMLGLGNNITNLGSLFSNMAGSSNAFISMAGKGLTHGYKFVSDIAKPFTTVTDAITTLGKTAVNKVGGFFGFDPMFAQAPRSFDEAFSNISGDFRNMWSEDRWNALENTTSNRETLNELQNMSQENLDARGFSTEAGFTENLKGATATADGFIDKNLQRAGGGYEYTRLEVGEGQDLNVFDPDFDPSVDNRTFAEKTTESLLGAPDRIVGAVVTTPERAIESAGVTAFNQAIGLAPRPGDLVQEQSFVPERGQINYSPTRTAAMFQEFQDSIDPALVAQSLYYQGDSAADAFYNGVSYGGFNSVRA